MPDTMIERAARALHRSRMERQHPKPDDHPWESLPKRDQALRRVDARAILKAMREPTAAMIGAAAECESSLVADVYTAMIDAALAEG